MHIPSSAVRSAVLARDTGKTKAAPDIVRQEKGLLLGNNIHAEELQFTVRFISDQRVRHHVSIIGASGTGKSTLLFNLIQQDIEKGEGIAVLDPHGDLIDQILGASSRSNALRTWCWLTRPTNNIPSASTSSPRTATLKRTCSSSGLGIRICERLSTSWGDQMGSACCGTPSWLSLESDSGRHAGRLAPGVFIEPAFREKHLKSVRDPDIVYYWMKGFAQLSGNKSIGPVITRLDTFLAPKPIRYMVSQTVPTG